MPKKKNRDFEISYGVPSPPVNPRLNSAAAGPVMPTPREATILKAANTVLNQPPALPAAPVAPPPSALLDALQGVLASIPEPPSLDSFLQPFADAEGRARQSYDAALPRIADAYIALRDKLAAGAAAAEQQAQAAHAGLQQSFQQGEQRVNSLQQQALADLMRQGGGDPALGSLTSAAQAQAGANQATLALQGQQVQQFPQQQQASLQGQFADRRASADTLEAASRDNALANLNALLNVIGQQRAGATAEYAQLTRQLSGDRANAQLAYARALDDQQQRGQAMNDPGNVLNRLQAEQALRAFQYDQSALDAQKWSGRRSGTPTTMEYFQALVSMSGDLNEALANLADDLNTTAQQAPDKSKGGKNVFYGGKRLDGATIKSWLSEYYRDRQQALKGR